MPSHTFYRVGRYKDAMMSNVQAVALDKAYDRLASPPGGVKAMRLHAHNIHFGMGGALMAGGAEKGLELADWYMAAYPGLMAAPRAGEEGFIVYRQIMAALAEAGAEGIILGCTEISLLVDHRDATVPLLDTTVLHARAAALRALGG